MAGVTVPYEAQDASFQSEGDSLLFQNCDFLVTSVHRGGIAYKVGGFYEGWTCSKVIHRGRNRGRVSGALPGESNTFIIPTETLPSFVYWESICDVKCRIFLVHIPKDIRRWK